MSSAVRYSGWNSPAGRISRGRASVGAEGGAFVSASTACEVVTTLMSSKAPEDTCDSGWREDEGECGSEGVWECGSEVLMPEVLLHL